MKRSGLLFVISLLIPFHVSGAPPDDLRILFIGNSLTYMNDLPAMVTAIGRAGGVRVTTGSVSFPNFSLGDHLLDGRAMTALQSAKWDYVVLQQGPTTQLESRQELLRTAGVFAPAIRRSGARPVLFSAWPGRTRATDFGAVSMSFKLAARSIDGVFAPAGDVWVRAWKSDSRIEFYAPDGFHPSAAGSFAAALTIYRTVAGAVPREVLEPDAAIGIAGSSLGLSRRQLKIVAEAAEATVR